MKPKQMKMLRTKTIRTKFGHTVHFTKNKPTPVPGMAIETCIAAGGVFCGDDEDYVTEGELKKDEAAPLFGFERKKKLLEVCRKIAAKNVPDDFTATGVPKLRQVEEDAGFTINRAELNDVWRDYQQEQIG